MHTAFSEVGRASQSHGHHAACDQLWCWVFKNSGVVKAGPARHVPSQSTMFIPLMSRDLVWMLVLLAQWLRWCLANNNDLAMPLFENVLLDAIDNWLKAGVLVPMCTLNLWTSTFQVLATTFEPLLTSRFTFRLCSLTMVILWVSL